MLSGSDVVVLTHEVESDFTQMVLIPARNGGSYGSRWTSCVCVGCGLGGMSSSVRVGYISAVTSVSGRNVEGSTSMAFR